ncbi:hypothetical protein M153_24060001229 [Pseudoloma neurophilia]|uniref:Transposase Tc1-like domain-containing protein n=1 Tax=Pseudoloma neurophilia TaxID=146866 RepID=A0A0R0M3A0_9MICR|nr:hypothetical protein M153_24060001229 [Pseudoloma neurophilia]
MGKHLTEFKKGVIYGMHMAKKSLRDIEAETGIKKSTANDIIKKMNEEGTFSRKVGTGVTKKLSFRESICLADISNKNSKLNLREIGQEFESQTQKALSRGTIRNYLKDKGIKARVARKKPKLTEIQKKKRFEMVIFYLGKKNNYWRKILYYIVMRQLFFLIMPKIAQ